MDQKPFLEFDITKLKEGTVHEIAKFHKSNFDVAKIVNNASALKYTKEIKKLITEELQTPSYHFVKLFAGNVYSGRLTEKVMREFTDLVGKAFTQTISEKVNDRLNAALNKEAEQQQEETQEPKEASKIETTEEELEGFRVVVAILRRKLPVERIMHRDTQSYFGILLDDNNRKPLCRLHLNSGTKYIGIIDQNKDETRHSIASVDDIYKFEEYLLKTVDLYENE
ncbi:hypothetical protein [uncultured Croceitalea sp.]|uniref:hypothetical protein n=1 Tax=uncultured Croceitalea sp. TaxID=1798908 RepID=UPI00374E7059